MLSAFDVRQRKHGNNANVHVDITDRNTFSNTEFYKHKK